MRIARTLVVVGLIGLVVPVTAQAMPLSDPPGDVKRADVDLLGGVFDSAGQPVGAPFG